MAYPFYGFLPYLEYGYPKDTPPSLSWQSTTFDYDSRVDDEEFYRPYLLSMQDEEDALALCNIYYTGLALAARWVYFYNVQRPHLGKGMEEQTPLEVFHCLGYNGPDQIALFPPILLNTISTDLLLACDPESGSDLLTYYKCEKAWRE